MKDCEGTEIKIGQIVEIPNHPSNCFVHEIHEDKNLAVVENDLGYFCNVDKKDVHVLEEIVMSDMLMSKN